MNAKTFYFWAVPVVLLFATQCHAAPSSGYNRPSHIAEDNQAALRQLRTALNDLKYEVNNHETEIKAFEARLHNQENLVENLGQQFTDSVQAQQDVSRAQSINLEGKIESLDNIVKGLISDLRQMKGQANDSVNILGQYKQKLSEIEKIIEAQNQHMKNLEMALNSIVEVLQAKEATEKVMTKTAATPKTYKVQPGDTLEKIARAHKVSVQALRDYNKLSQDRITVGQTLKIP